MSNFTFLDTEWPNIAESARLAESYVLSDARTACFYARRALEQTVAWLYDHDPLYKRPYDDNLAALLSHISFRENVPAQIIPKAHLIRKAGNIAVHTHRTVKASDAMAVARELYHILYWLARTYTQEDPRNIPTQFDENLIPPSVQQIKTQSAAQLKKLEETLSEKDHRLKEQADLLERTQAQIEALQKQIARTKENNARIDIPHDYTEAETRTLLIDILLREAGWDPQGKNVAEYEVRGMPNRPAKGYVDYVLWGDDGLPLALVEAKRTSSNPDKGKQQAKLYADCLQQMYGQRPIIFYSNGYQTQIWDDLHYPPRPIQGFYRKDELQLMIQRRQTSKNLADITINRQIVDRYYQDEAIRALCQHLEQCYRKGLLVMATGTGKTRVTIALVDLLMRANWVKRALFLADRQSLVRQAVNAFKKHLPESNPVNLLEEKEAQESRVVVSTYHTMMGMIDEMKSGGERHFTCGHFDLIIIDEAHRSVYHKFGAIFDYFDSLLVGLTATPKDDIDRNTYRLFELEDGVPNFSYELERAVGDGYLVPPKALSVPVKFQREGINYDDLTDAEKLEWELIDWNDEGQMPERVEAGALNSWLFNQDTVDKVLEHLMRHGLKVKGGDRLGKTIIFAKNHNHAEFIQKRFDANYPHLQGRFARVIDNYQEYAQSLIDDFSSRDSDPHIAISVDMLDTGIDIHEVVNLVFFKLVRSKTKFFQMLGRGTRLCTDLFGPGQDKEFFNVFDYCQNFEFFNENPAGSETRPVEPLSQRIFKKRLDLLAQTDTIKNNDPDAAKLADDITEILHERVAAMPLDNFIVRPKRKYLDQFILRTAWNSLTQADIARLADHISGLPTSLPPEEETALRFDLLALNLQLAFLQSTASYQRMQQQIIELAHQLEGKSAIPMVNAQMALILDIQQTDFWDSITLQDLENIRRNLRNLIKFIDQREKRLIYTDFNDELGEIQEANAPYLTGGVNTLQYRKKIEQYIRQHQNQQVIRKIRFAMPLDSDDLAQLEEFLFQAGELGSREEFEQAFGKQQSLSLFIRTLVGLDRKAALQAFSDYLDEKNFTAEQIRFVNYIIDHLTANGVMKKELLYEQPYTDIHERGLDGVFPTLEEKILAIIGNINQSAYGV